MKNTQDLLHGNIKSELIALTIPLVLGNILQQFYNTIDSFIVGDMWEQKPLQALALQAVS